MKFLTFVLASLLVVSFSATSMHKDGKKTEKAGSACCADKSAVKGASNTKDSAAKKDGAKECCNMEKAEMKDGKGAEKMDCCADHEKAENVKTKSTDTKGTR